MLQFVFGFCEIPSDHEINILKSILYKNSYPRDFVDKCIKTFLDRVLTRKILLSKVPKKDLVLPYYHITILPYRTTILPYYHIWVNFRFKFALELIV